MPKTLKVLDINIKPNTSFVQAARLSSSSVSGVTRHDELTNRNLADQHPISAITNLAHHVDFWNGTFVEPFDALVTSDGTTVIMSLEAKGTGDLTMRFSDGESTLDCTPAATVTLTVGSNASPTQNYTYVLQSTKAITVSTSGWPSTEHIKIAYTLVPSASFVQSDGVYINQNWNDASMGSDGQGHLSHMAMRSRRDGAYYYSGVDANGTDQSSNTSYFDYTSVAVAYFKSASGVIMQMHEHAVPAIDTSTDDILVVNWSGGAYHVINNLASITTDSTGASLANKYFNVFFFIIGNKGGEYAPLMAQLPSGGYSSQSNAENDIDLYDNNVIPREYALESSTGVPICRMTLRWSGGTNTLNHMSTLDMRRFAGNSGGGSGSGGTTFADNLFAVYDNSDNTKVLAFDVGTNVTTGTTRTLKVPDADGTIMLDVSGTSQRIPKFSLGGGIEDSALSGLLSFGFTLHGPGAVETSLSTSSTGELLLTTNTGTPRLYMGGTYLSDSAVGTQIQQISEDKSISAELAAGTGEFRVYFDGVTGAYFNRTTGLGIDKIGELTIGAGVTIDGLLIKDGSIPVGAITEHVASIDHDATLNFEEGEHIDWSVTGTEDIHADRIGTSSGALLVSGSVAGAASFSQTFGVGITTDDVFERTPHYGVTILDVRTDEIKESTTDAGITIHDDVRIGYAAMTSGNPELTLYGHDGSSARYLEIAVNSSGTSFITAERELFLKSFVSDIEFQDATGTIFSVGSSGAKIRKTNTNVFLVEDDSGTDVFAVNTSTPGVTVTGTLDVTGATDIAADITLSGGTRTIQTTVGGGSDLSLDGDNALVLKSSTSNIYLRSVSGSVSINDSADSGSYSANSSLSVGKDASTGYSRFLLRAGGGYTNLTQSSAGTFTITPYDGTLNVTGNLDVTGAVGIDGDFDIATNKFTVAAATGNTVIAGTLDVTGLVDVENQIKIQGGSPAVNKFLSSDAGGTGTWSHISPSADSDNFLEAGSDNLLYVNETGVFEQKGTNLWYNGSGALEDNSNFTGFTFEPEYGYVGAGGFYTDTYNAVKWSSKLIDVDPTQSYRMSGWIHEPVWVGQGQYLAIIQYDADGLSISPWMGNPANRVTQTPNAKLTVKWTPGDSTMTLDTDDGGEFNEVSTSRAINLGPFKNALGYTHPAYKYTRHADIQLFTVSGDVITLANDNPSELWNPDEVDGSWPVGTPVWQSWSSGSYIYPWNGYPAQDGSTGTSAWQNVGGDILSSAWWYGINRVKPGFSVNHTTAGGDVTWSGLRFEIKSGGTIDGSGTAGKLAKWSDTDTLADSVIEEDTGRIGIGITPTEKFHVDGGALTSIHGTGVNARNQPLLSLIGTGAGGGATDVIKGIEVDITKGVNSSYLLALKESGNILFSVNTDGNTGIKKAPDSVASLTVDKILADTFYFGNTSTGPYWTTDVDDNLTLANPDNNTTIGGDTIHIEAETDAILQADWTSGVAYLQVSDGGSTNIMKLMVVNDRVDIVWKGTIVGRIDSSGNLKVAGNLTTNATIT